MLCLIMPLAVFVGTVFVIYLQTTASHAARILRVFSEMVSVTVTTLTGLPMRVLIPTLPKRVARFCANSR